MIPATRLRRGILCLILMLTALSLVTSGPNGATHAAASTAMSGLISQDTTWTAVNSPYIVIGDLTIAPSVTLTIQPGVEVRFNQDVSLNVNGSLYALGTEDAPITFTSNRQTPKPGDWNTLRFVGTDDEAFAVDNTIIEYATKGITVDSLAKVEVNNSKITNNLVSGIHLANESYVMIEHNMIRLNQNGVSSSGSVSGVEILDNFFDSCYNGIYFNATAESIGSGNVRISNIAILNNTLSSNVNAIKFYAFPIVEARISNITISRNTVNFNKNGIYMYIWGGFYSYGVNFIYNTSISENLIYSNENYGIYLNSTGPWLGVLYDVSISNNKIKSNGIGVLLYAISHYSHVEFDVVIVGNIVSENQDKGIYVDGGPIGKATEGLKTSITHNSISYSAYGIFYEGDTANVAHFNDIHHNTYGAYVSNGATVNATQNYWGNLTGPYHSYLNTNGTGNPVNGNGTNLAFRPFLDNATSNEPPTAELDTNQKEFPINQAVTFNASRSIDDDGRVVSYWFDFGDGTNSGWIAQPTTSRTYTTVGVYMVSLRVTDDLGFQSNMTSIVISVKATLIVTIDADSEEVLSGEELTIVVRVTDGATSVSDSTVTLTSDMGGVFTPVTGETNSSGQFVSVFTAPAVTEKTVLTVIVEASKSGYWDGQEWVEVNLAPRNVTSSGFDFFWLLAGAAAAVILSIVFLALRKRKTGSPP